MFPIRRTPTTVALTAMALAASPAMAEVPRVVADIAPVHSLVSIVMQGVGEPDLLIPATATPHDFALRPSDAGRLQQADLVVWIGDDLTPWLTRPLSIVAEGAVNLPLIELSVTTLREGGHDHAEHAHEAEDHDDHSDHDAHEDHADHEDHAEHEGHDDHDDEDDHQDEAHDPHVWLDPINAAAWLPEIATALAALDPENAAQYRTNAEQGATMLTALVQEFDSSGPTPRYITSHDAFGYFEDRFGVHALGSLAESDASAPGPARLSALRDAARDADVRCVLIEPQFNTGLADAVVPEGLKLGQIDAMGASLPLGPTLYPDMIQSIADAITGCLDD